MRLNFASGRPPLHVSQRRDCLTISQDRALVRLTADEALRVADALVDLVESRA